MCLTSELEDLAEYNHGIDDYESLSSSTSFSISDFSTDDGCEEDLNDINNLRTTTRGGYAAPSNVFLEEYSMITNSKILMMRDIDQINNIKWRKVNNNEDEPERETVQV